MSQDAGPTVTHRNVELAVKIVSSFVAHNALPANDLSGLIGSVHLAIGGLGTDQPVQTAPKEPQAPAVPIKKSIFPDYIVCLEDGKKLKTMKRHLMSKFSLSPQQYRTKWGLAPDYPMVAPDYAAQRSTLAKSIGLGRPGRLAQTAETTATPPKATAKTDKPKSRGGKKAETVSEAA